MSVSRVLVINSEKGDLQEFHVSGTSYAPIGDFQLPSGKKGSLSNYLVNGSIDPAKNPVLLELSHIASVCNDSEVTYDVVLCYKHMCM